MIVATLDSKTVESASQEEVVEEVVEEGEEEEEEVFEEEKEEREEEEMRCWNGKGEGRCVTGGEYSRVVKSAEVPQDR